MASYVKVCFQGEIYGSIRSPVSLNLLCSLFKVSPRASPTLVSLDTKHPLIVSDMEKEVEEGFFELVSRRDIPYDPNIDYLPPLSRNRRVHSRTRTTEDQNSTSNQPDTFPIPDDEMSLAIRAMLHVISSIPPRYLNFNVILANQVERAIEEVEKLQKILADLTINSDESVHRYNRSKKIPLDLTIHKTFIQYRILNVLHQTWKAAWDRVSPISRYFSISDIKIMDSVELSEVYLNRLNSWRRILEKDKWNALVSHIPLPKPSDLNPRKKIYNPRGLTSDKNPKAWTYLVRPSTAPVTPSNVDTPKVFLDPVESLNSFRKMYIESMKAQKITKDEELNVLLVKMLQLEMKLKSQSTTEQIVYPFSYIKKAIQKEFKLK